MSQDDELKKLVIDSSLEAIKVGYAEGRLFEQERIIKLLKELAEVTGYVEIKLDSLIALIKGEQK